MREIDNVSDEVSSFCCIVRTKWRLVGPYISQSAFTRLYTRNSVFWFDIIAKSRHTRKLKPGCCFTISETKHFRTVQNFRFRLPFVFFVVVATHFRVAVTSGRDARSFLAQRRVRAPALPSTRARAALPARAQTR